MCIFFLLCLNVYYKIDFLFIKNLIKGAYDRSKKYVKRPSTRKRKPKNIWIIPKGVTNFKMNSLSPKKYIYIIS